MNGQRFHPTSMVLGLVFFGLGIAFLLDQLEVISLDAYYVLPILLVGLGLAVVAGALTSRTSSEA